MAKVMGISYKEIHERVEGLMESNPMLGLRGCRLGNLYPEITEMQTRAIMEAAVELKEEGINVIPEIMVPLIGIVNEFMAQKEIIEHTIQQVFAEKSDSVEYKIGTMIEIPRAALTANEIAKEADFFSFGTNDLTQMTFGYSRDDVGKFLQMYLDKGILKQDPLLCLIRTEWGSLYAWPCKKGAK